MQGKNAKKFIIAICASAVVVATGLTGCRTGAADHRSAGTKKDDEIVTKNVEKKLKEHPVYKFEGVKVNTYNGVVQMSGFVHNPDEKRVAVQLASTTPGAREVLDSIAVQPPPSTATGAPTGEYYYGGAGTLGGQGGTTGTTQGGTTVITPGPTTNTNRP